MSRQLVHSNRRMGRGPGLSQVLDLDDGRYGLTVNDVGVTRLVSIRGAPPLGLPYTRSRAPRRRRAPIAWLARRTRSLSVCEMASNLNPRGFAPRTPRHALSRAASSARSDRVARSRYSLARHL